MKYLHGHTSEETAYLVDDYPYGFRLRCKIRYWIETTKNGQRFCSQTTNPKRPGTVWNKPKKSTYCALMVLTQDESNGHISSTGVHKGWDGWDKVEPWLERTGIDQADAYVAETIREIKIITKAQSVLTCVIRPSSGDPEIERKHREESEEAQRKALAYGIYSVNKGEI